ncbi:MAG: hypothetical protein WA864_11275 [Acetobacteraceae bacterium]
MTDDLILDADTLRQKASAFRRLAAEILGGDFRRSLLELALEYDRRALRLERSRGVHATVPINRVSARN